MIRVEDLKTFCLDGVSLEIPGGHYGVLMGKTGSGKTTLLECLCGLRPIDGGSIYLAGEEVTTCKAAKRNIGYVPQDGALFPTMKVRENLSLSLEVRNWASPKIAERVDELAELLSISHLLDRRPANLSGGEAQRIKLSTELSRRATGATLYILDEPTTGLSFEDCAHLLQVLHRLVDAGNTVILIEHHLDLIKNADWIIDVGPGGGNDGGYVIAEGTPEEVASMDHSQTGHYLKPHLHQAKRSKGKN